MSKSKDPFDSVRPDNEEIITDIKANMEILFGMRLIEKISRPISDTQRHSILDLFKRRFN